MVFLKIGHPSLGSRGSNIAGRKHYNSIDAPFNLCIAFENGKLQLSRGDNDPNAEIIDTRMINVLYCKWSTKGNLLAVVGEILSGMIMICW